MVVIMVCTRTNHLGYYNGSNYGMYKPINFTITMVIIMVCTRINHWVITMAVIKICTRINHLGCTQWQINWICLKAKLWIVCDDKLQCYVRGQGGLQKGKSVS